MLNFSKSDGLVILLIALAGGIAHTLHPAIGTAYLAGLIMLFSLFFADALDVFWKKINEIEKKVRK